MAANTSAQLRFLTDAAHLLRQSAPETSAFLMRRRADIVDSVSQTSSPAGQAMAGFLRTDAQRQHVCACCGHILIPGSNGTTLAIQSSRPTKSAKKRKRERQQQKLHKQQYGDQKKNGGSAKSSDRAPSRPAESAPHTPVPHVGITKVFACGSCHRETRIALPPPPPLSRQKKRAKQSMAETSVSAAQPSHPPTAKTGMAAPAAPPKATSNASSKKRAKDRKAGLLALLDKSKASSSGFGGLGLSLADFRQT